MAALKQEIEVVSGLPIDEILNPFILIRSATVNLDTLVQTIMDVAEQLNDDAPLLRQNKRDADWVCRRAQRITRLCEIIVDEVKRVDAQCDEGEGVVDRHHPARAAA